MSIAIGFLIGVSVIGLIAWVVVGVIQSRRTDSFTLATATALYSRVLFVAGIIIALSGVGNSLKALFGFINLNYSYFDYAASAYKGAPPGAPIPAAPGAGYLEQQRGQDLVLGVTLIVIGLAISIGHYYLAAAIAKRPGGSPGWITRGTTLALAVTTAAGAIPTAAFGLYEMLSYFILGASQSASYGGPAQTWGDPLGAAIAFVPAWIIVMVRLIRNLRLTVPTAPLQPANAGPSSA